MTLITYRCLVFYNKVSLKILLNFNFFIITLTRIPSISLCFVFSFIFNTAIKKNSLRQLVNYLFIFLLVTIFVYIIINGELEFYLNYYKNSPLFNNYSDINFFNIQRYKAIFDFLVFRLLVYIWKWNNYIYFKYSWFIFIFIKLKLQRFKIKTFFSFYSIFNNNYSYRTPSCC